MAQYNINLHTSSNPYREKPPKISLVSTSSKIVPHKFLNHAVPLKHLRSKQTEQIAVFLLKVAALEAIRRLSKVRCPIVWRIIEAMQLLGYLPFKWIQKFGPLRAIVNIIQKFSRPLLCISIGAALFDHSETSERNEYNIDDSHSENSQLDSFIDSGSQNEPSNSDLRQYDEISDASRNIISENWVGIVLRELDKEGLSLPERFGKEELRQYYAASKGNIPLLISSLKRSIYWRETYNFLSSQELEEWSTMVFWHGYDLLLRPCLFIRLGFTCSILSPSDIPRFCQAIVSQIEFGVRHLINEEDPRITVLMDCQGLSPFRFPMQMMKTCANILQDHYPNRLAVLFIVRLPPLSRVIIQTFMNILKPATRQKVRIEGQSYLKVLSEFFQNVPEFLGGNCMCSKCTLLRRGKKRAHITEETAEHDPSVDSMDNDQNFTTKDSLVTEILSDYKCEHYLRTAVLSILVLCIIVALIAGIYDPRLPMLS